ncbi:YagK/YfjJ domain-containing protein [Paralysiella testudinis]|uniref:Inovirus-type Gp2 protein n=1 Tax=Paralysiella testudinis TaxID=2809020 RepID=A0A892ZDV6_9NEIS|nr:inovirus-type Gp2 protein [Paralysiella testudinis]QRQ80843.1 inovirus-type Gp2 protein [Paralysiella testudinis]
MLPTLPFHTAYSINRQNQNKLFHLIDTLFIDYSKLLVIRVDLAFIKEYVPMITPQYCKSKFTQLRNNMRANTLFEHYLAYAAKLEYAAEKGWHYHVLFFFNGQCVHGDIHLSQQIGAYWNTIINRDIGLYHSCNMHKDRYEFSPLGVIDYADTEKIQQLKAISAYLCKEQGGEMEAWRDRAGKSLRSFNTSHYQPKISGLGRPRRYG